MSDDQRSMRERMLAGDLYIADDPILHEEHQRATALMEAYNASTASDPHTRRRILGELLGSLGDETVILPPVYCDYGRHTHVGARTFANFGLVALDVAPIRIGDDVQIGPNVQLLTPTHPLEADPRRDKWRRRRRSRWRTTCGWAGASSSAPASQSARTPSWAPARS